MNKIVEKYWENVAISSAFHVLFCLAIVSICKILKVEVLDIVEIILIATIFFIAVNCVFYIFIKVTGITENENRKKMPKSLRVSEGINQLKESKMNDEELMSLRDICKDVVDKKNGIPFSKNLVNLMVSIIGAIIASITVQFICVPKEQYGKLLEFTFKCILFGFAIGPSLIASSSHFKNDVNSIDYMHHAEITIRCIEKILEL